MAALVRSSLDELRERENAHSLHLLAQLNILCNLHENIFALCFLQQISTNFMEEKITCN